MTSLAPERILFAPAHAAVEASLQRKGFARVRSKAGVTVWRGNREPDMEAADFPRGWHLMCLLDRYYLLTPSRDQVHDRVVEEFCATIALDFHANVRVERNLDNIRRLRTHLERLGIDCSQSRILDFGCGPGLSLQIFECRAPSGFDQSVEMRACAEKAGMTVFTETDLLSQERFHAILASYVLHMRSGARALWLAASCLAQGGLFVANFHKGAGREWSDRILAAADCAPEYVDEGQAASHGPIVAYRRGSAVHVPQSFPLAVASRELSLLALARLLASFEVDGEPWALVEDAIDFL